MSSSDSVTLVSKDGKEFLITLKEASCSAMLSGLLRSDWKESAERKIALNSIDSDVLDVVVKVRDRKFCDDDRNLQVCVN